MANREQKFESYSRTIGEIEKEISKYSRKINSLRKEIEAIENARTEVCEHTSTSILRHYDDGNYGNERVIPSTWYTEECDDCGAVVAFKGDRLEDEWKPAPEGSKNTMYGVTFPNGYVYRY